MKKTLAQENFPSLLRVTLTKAFIRENYDRIKTNVKSETSGQDGGVGMYTLPPCTTNRRTTTFKNKETTRTARKPNCMEV